MMNITAYPYFQYNSQIDLLMTSLKEHEVIELIGFRRMYPNKERFHICYHHQWAIDFYKNGLYQYCPYEKEPSALISSYDIWDSILYHSPELYLKSFLKFNLAHGLTIVKQYKNHSDSFIFASTPENFLINNFYLNHKKLFNQFVKNFYIQMEEPLKLLSAHKFSIAQQLPNDFFSRLTPRQKECVDLLFEGESSKEIAKTLELSYRTIESYIEALKKKFHAKNRVHLVTILSELQQTGV